MTNSNFKRGSGVYTCTCCKRQTRDVGNPDATANRMCDDCYELAGIYNAYQDGNVSEYAEEIVTRTNSIVAKGGKLDGDALELLEAIKPTAA